jgi:AAA family ATPase
MSNQAALLATLKGLKVPSPSGGAASSKSKKGTAATAAEERSGGSAQASPAPPVLPGSRGGLGDAERKGESPRGSSSVSETASPIAATRYPALSPAHGAAGRLPGLSSPQLTPVVLSKQELPITSVLGNDLVEKHSSAFPPSCCSSIQGRFPAVEVAPTMLAKLRLMPGDLVTLKARFDASVTGGGAETPVSLALPFLIASAYPARGVADGTVKLPPRSVLPDAMEVEVNGCDAPEGVEAAAAAGVGTQYLTVPLSGNMPDGSSLSIAPFRLETGGSDVTSLAQAVASCKRKQRSTKKASAGEGETSVAATSVEVDASAAAKLLTGAASQHAFCGLLFAATQLPAESPTTKPVTVRTVFTFTGAALKGTASATAGSEGEASTIVLKAVKNNDLITIRSRMPLAFDDTSSSNLLLAALWKDSAFSPATISTAAPFSLAPSTLAGDAGAATEGKLAAVPASTEDEEDEKSDPVLSQLASVARACLFQSDLYRGYGLSPPKGALLVGPPGTGKTLMATRLSNLLKVPLLALNTASVVSSLIGETEARIKKAFQAARERSSITPGGGGCILFIDEVDGLAPRRDAGVGGGSSFSEVDARVVATLLACMDGLVSKSSTAATTGASGGPVFILAATNRASAVDPALRRPGRLDTEILVSAPSEAERRIILKRCLRKYSGNGSTTTTEGSPRIDQDLAVISQISRVTHGYVGADLDSLAREAAACAVRRACMEGTGTASVQILPSDLHAALRVVQPSALREVSVEVPHVRWSDIAGQEATKRRLLEAVEWPLTHAEAFKRMGIRPPRGVLLYGPPGCSKTLMAKAMATESSMNFISVKGPELFSCYVGDSEKAVAEVFQRARSVAPCVVFFDELDALAGKRDADSGGGRGGGPSVGTRVVSQLLAELDGISGLKQVVVVGATNRPDLIDSALLRPGRIDSLLYVGPPDDEAISDLIDRQLRSIPHALFQKEGSSDVVTGADSAVWKDKSELVEALRGYSGAEIVAVFRDASIRAVAACLNSTGSEEAGTTSSSLLLRPEHVRAAIAATPKQITPEMLAFYHNFSNGSSKGGKSG